MDRDWLLGVCDSERDVSDVNGDDFCLVAKIKKINQQNSK